jgi:hypothetical protein
MNVMEYIYLFGHRQQAGKDSSVEIIKDILDSLNISHISSYFAKKLKEQTAEKYGLDFNKMGDDIYKKSKPVHLDGNLTIRDILIKEGCCSRDIWQNVWAFPLYKELLLSECRIGLVSDFRYPSEYLCFDECFNIINTQKQFIKPKLIKVLVYKPDGKFINDGPDNQLPDLDSYWDFTIINDDKTPDWKQNIKRQLKNMIKSTIGVNNVLR